MNRWHVLTILAVALLWTAAIITAIALVYAFALDDVKEVEIRAVALTALVFTGFLLIRLPLALFRAVFASYVVMPLMGFRTGTGSSRRGRLFNSWIRMLDSAGWEYSLTEKPSYERIADRIHSTLTDIKGQMQNRGPYEYVPMVHVIDQHAAFDAGEEWIRGRLVNLDYFEDRTVLRQIAARARSESVRRAARRRLIDLEVPDGRTE